MQNDDCIHMLQLKQMADEVNNFTFKKEFYLMTKYNLDTSRTLIATL